MNKAQEILNIMEVRDGDEIWNDSSYAERINLIKKYFKHISDPKVYADSEYSALPHDLKRNIIQKIRESR